MKNLILNRRTVRKYKNVPIKKDYIDTIIQTALTAPSGRNLKPVEIILVQNKETLFDLSNARGKASQWIKDAPLGFVIIADDSISDTWISDSAIVATYIQLVGESLGLKSCWMHVENRMADNGTIVEENVQDILNIPSNMRVHSMISMGYPDEEKKPHNIDSLDYNKVHFEKY